MQCPALQDITVTNFTALNFELIKNTHVRSGSNFSVLLNRLDMAVPACPESLLICGEDLLLVWSLEE